MADCLDMALDDVILKNKKERSGGSGSRGGGGRARSRGGGDGGVRGGGGGGGRPFPYGYGPGRRFGARRGVHRPSPYFPPATGSLFGEAAMPVVEPKIVPARSNGGGGREGTRLYLSNLDYGVTNQDIKVLFSDVGELKRYSIHYDKSGRSKGTAEVVYERHGDALAAIRRYNNVALDGRPIRIEVIGTKVLPPPRPAAAVPTNMRMANPPPPLPAPAATNNMIRPKDPFLFGSFCFSSGAESFSGRTPTFGGSSFGKHSGPMGGVGQGIEWGKKMTAEELDAELDQYRFGAMEIE